MAKGQHRLIYMGSVMYIEPFQERWISSIMKIFVLLETKEIQALHSMISFLSFSEG